MAIKRRLFGHWAILLASLCLALAAAQSATVRTAENAQQALTAQINPTAASGQVHIVEIDAKSIAATQSWPWSRDHHARLVRELDAAGARSIVFDIDFSSDSTSDGDAAFAKAIADARASVVLPTFSQSATEQSARQLDALPIAALRENTSLASASVLPDEDARVRRMVFGTVTNGTPRPSMSAQIAGAQGAVDSSFAIDFSIDPATIPRHSFADVEIGKFDASSVAGKDVLVGATAIELGDRYGVPIYGVIPGVTIQALAAETLIAGGLTEIGWVPFLALGLIIAFMLTRIAHYGRLAGAYFAASLGLMLLYVAAYHGAKIVADIVPALILLASTAIGQAMRIARVQFRDQAMRDSESGLPNALAFARVRHAEDELVATAHIKQFDAIQAVLGKDEIGAFVNRLVERVQTVGDIGVVYHVESRMLAWKHGSDHRALTDQFTQINKALHKPIEIAGTRVDVSLAFGIAAGSDLAAASRAASDALREGKIWHAHEVAEAAMVERRVSLMGELDDAIAAGELTVVYQPKLRLSSDEIESVEALVRWNHPVRGFLSPDHFIPMAEEANRIEPMTLFVLSQTIEDLRSWADAGVIISAAVNISANLVSSDAFMSSVEHLLTEAGVPRDRLIFEVTESATMNNPDVAAVNLERLRDLGVAISMDDYGTGQSTLSYLQLLPLTELKIDRAFVENAHKDRSDALLVRSTVQLAHSLGLRVVGEGVEEQECLDFLREVGCDYAQGYFIAKPMDAANLKQLLAAKSQKAEPLSA